MDEWMNEQAIQTAHAGEGITDADFVPQVWGERWERGPLLARFGLTPDTLEAWATRAEELKRRPRQVGPAPYSDD